MNGTGRGLEIAGLLAALAWSAGVIRPGRWTSAARIATAALLGASVTLLVAALIGVDGTNVYVADHTRRDAAWPIRVAGLWAGMEGSLLFFTALVAVTLAIGVRGAGTGRGSATCGALVAGLTTVSIVWSDPFATLAIPAIDGAGLLPILEHPAMTWHPPLLYLGLALLTVAFAAAIERRWQAGSGEPPARPALRDDRWLLASSTLLAVAMALGGLWSYDEVGWGGFWAWDPVENGVLVPWLLVLAALHTRWPPARGSRPSDALVTLALVSALLGTVLTRSGAAPSVHAFAQSPTIGAALLAVVAFVTILALTPWVRSSAHSAELRTQGDRPGWARRAGIAGMGAAAGLVVVGTVWPVVLSWTGRSATVAPVWFVRVTTPVALLLAVLVVRWMVAPGGAARGRGDGGRLPKPMRTSALVAHAGYLVLLIGLAGTAFGRDEGGTLRPGEPTTLAGVTMRTDGARTQDEGRIPVVSAEVVVTDGGRSTVLVPAIEGHPARGATLMRPATWRRWDGDVQIALTDASDDGRVVLAAHTRPLIQLVWLGSVLIAAAGLLAMRASPGSPAAHTDDRHARPHQDGPPESTSGRPAAALALASEELVDRGGVA